MTHRDTAGPKRDDAVTVEGGHAEETMVVGIVGLLALAYASQPEGGALRLELADGMRVEVVHAGGVLTLTQTNGALVMRDASAAAPHPVHGPRAVDRVAGSDAPKAAQPAGALLVPRPPHAPDRFDEPIRGSLLALSDALTPPMRARVRAETPDGDLTEALGAWLDRRAHYPHHLALEELIVGAPDRAHAIALARSAGELDAEDFSIYLRYVLPHDGVDAAGLRASMLRVLERVDADERRAAAVAARAPASAGPRPSGAPVRSTAIDDRLTRADLAWPLRNAYTVTSRFGNRKHPILGRVMHHNGIDLAVPIGTPLYAPADGTLVAIDENPISGRFVTIDHGGGVRTSYAHLHGLPAVPLGTAVQRGQRFATTGNSGRSTGPHLHYMVLVDGKAIDPELAMPGPKAGAKVARAE
jgi:murein DD-endopeptidase MepM/ murein hydrolase activator NlpD